MWPRGVLNILFLGMWCSFTYGLIASDFKAQEHIDDFIEELFEADHYKKSRRPAQAIEVKIILHINSLSSLSEITMDYGIDMYFDQEWQDVRLAHNWTTGRITLDHDIARKLWQPDTYFLNAKHGHTHDLMVSNECAFLLPNGTVRYSKRVSLVVACTMNLHYFPMDEQHCSLLLGSYGHPAREISYAFIGNDSTTFEKKLILPDFILDTDNVEQIQLMWDFPVGKFSCLEFIFHLRRDFGYYLIQTYIPSMLVVLLSWLNFWLDIQATPARISVGCLTVLTLATQSSGVNAQLPRVSYIKAIDVWMSTCMVFVFGALLEFAVASVLARKDATRRENAVSSVSVAKPNDIPLRTIRNSSPKTIAAAENISSREFDCSWRLLQTADDPPVVKKRPRPRRKRTSASEKVENASRILFPLSFCVFNAVYWLHYWCRWFSSDKCKY
ncbi:glycine receptor subunit alpha-1-like isoform X2 [Lineus longissimus]|uniref:glycine receptor subunit alpha-1-like isoform X2 n=1 Tax=Lineus longissimus TaxID=88925 RepID=UPI00315D797B